jgi:leucyl-tRNA synthetase
MSKSRGKVIAPDTYVSELGADTVRVYLMFIGPWEQGGEWDDSGIKGISRWLNRVWSIVLEDYQPKAEDEAKTKELRHITHRTIKRVSQDLEKFHFNTMIAALMEFTNYLGKVREEGAAHPDAFHEAIDSLLLLTAPSTPHLAEELWVKAGHPYSIHNQAFPEWDNDLAAEEEVTLVIQVNGKLRDKLTVPVTIAEQQARELALGREKIKPYIDNKNISKVIYVPRRLINIVTS